MTVITTRPDTTLENVGAAITGGTAHVVLADDLDTTWVDLDMNDLIKVGFSEPSLPAGSAIRSAALRVRVAETTTPIAALSTEFLISDPKMLWGGAPWGFVDVVSSVWWGFPVTVNYIADAILTAAPTNYQAMVKRRSGTPGTIRVYALYMDTVYVVKPVVDVQGPAGTLVLTNPTITWRNVSFDPDGGEIRLVRMKVFTDAQYLAGGFDPATSTPFYDSGLVGVGASIGGSMTPGRSFKVGATSLQVPQSLPPDTYRAYIWTGQTYQPGTYNYILSDPDYAEFTIDTVHPGVPTLSTAAGAGKITLTVTRTTGTGGAVTNFYEVQRRVGSGDWETIRTLRPDGLIAASGASQTVVDWEVPNGSSVTYRARAIQMTDPAGVPLQFDPTHGMAQPQLTSDWSTVTAATSWSDDDWWLKCPTDPSLNTPVRIKGMASRSRAGRRAVHTPLGRTDSIVISDTYESWTGDIALRLDSDAERNAVEALVLSSDVLFLQGPNVTVYDWEDRYLSIGDYSRERLVDAQGFPWTVDTLSSCVSVLKPNGVMDGFT